MIERMRKTIDEFNLLDQGDCVVVGLSGGPDSTAMIHALNQLKGEYDLKIVAVHLNHQIRGKLADADQNYVTDLCGKLDIELHAFKEDIPKLAKDLRMTEEEAGRVKRYELFDQVCEEVGGQKIAIAQNKNDQVETFLMRMLRGASLDGLSSIKYKRDGKFIRPILACERSLIEDYCERHHLEARIDHTNLETDYLRNKIRIELIPQLMDKYNTNIIDTIARNVDLIQRDVDYLKEETQKIFVSLGRNTIDVVRLKNLHPAILSRYLRKLIECHSGSVKDVSSSQIDELVRIIDKNVSGKKVIIKKVEYKIENGNLVIGLVKKNTKTEINYTLTLGLNRIQIGEKLIDITVESIDGNNYDKSDRNVAYLDEANIKGKLIVRNRREGDTFKPVGFKGKTKKVKNFMIDEKIPQNERDMVLIFENQNRILWIGGYRLDNDYKVTAKTVKMVKITLA